MIAQVVRLTRWEWFKLRKRWIPWILLVIAVVVAQSFLWSSYISYETTEIGGSYSLPGPEERDRVLDPNQDRVTRTIEVAEEDPVIFGCEGVRKGELPPEVQSMSEEDQAQVFAICADEAEQERLSRELSRRSFILPDSLVRSLGFAHTIGAMLVLIMASLAMGVEYSWGTLRGVLTRGVLRWQFLGAKASLLVLMVAAGLLILSLTVVASSLVAALLTQHEGGGLADSGEWRTAAVMFGKMVYALTPYVILALFLSVLTASSSIGVALSLAYHLAEIFLMNTLLESFGSVSGFLLGPSVIAWMVEPGARIWAVDNIPVPVSDLPSNLHAFLVILGYVVVLSAVAFWRFQRKDVAGARGE